MSIATTSAEQVVANLQDEADRRISGRLSAAAARGAPSTCTAGCSACCRQLVVISPLEALVIRRYLDGDPALKSQIEAGLATWRHAAEAHRSLIPLLAVFREAHGFVDGTVGGQLEAAYWQARLPCPFLQNGLCAIYEIRPFACREHHVISDPTLCSLDLDAPTPAGTRMEYRTVAQELGVRCFTMPDALIALPDVLDSALALPDPAPEADAAAVSAAIEMIQRRIRLALAAMGLGRLASGA